ncbi:MAG: hypothetical protein ACP5NV_05950 [Candidatus Woesearchaeota archaeon]
MNLDIKAQENNSSENYDSLSGSVFQEKSSFEKSPSEKSSSEKTSEAIRVFSTVFKAFCDKDKSALESSEIIQYVDDNVHPLFKQYFGKVKDAYFR